MSVTWRGAEPLPLRPLGAADWVRIGLRGGVILSLLLVGFPLLMLLRLPERVLSGHHRPVTPWITQIVCRLTCAVLGLRLMREGRIDRSPGAFVSNHVSWLDIFVLNACTRLYFVAKSEVRGWPGIGWLARGVGTLFIARDRARAAEQAAALRDRLAAGHRLLFFPEGTSTDGCRVLPFRTTLFAAFFAGGLPDVSIQPVSLVYTPPPGAPGAFYGWWGDMDFGANLLRMLAAPRHGTARVIFHAPLRVAEMADRKTLAQRAEEAVRTGFEKAR